MKKSKPKKDTSIKKETDTSLKFDAFSFLEAQEAARLPPLKIKNTEQNTKIQKDSKTIPPIEDEITALVSNIDTRQNRTSGENTERELISSTEARATTTEGQLVFIPKEKIWVLDAEPHVVDLFARLFPGASLFHGRSSDLRLFTHRPRCISDGIDTRRNLEWFTTRFELIVSVGDETFLSEGTMAYEEIRKSAAEVLTSEPVLNLNTTIDLRKYQKQGVALFLKRKELLLADQVGLGKTPQAIAGASQNLPALAVVPPHLVKQWEEEIKKFLPSARTHIIYGRKAYDLPEADFYITAYSRVAAWADFFGPSARPIKTLILDEVHELRNSGTQKYEAVKSLSEVTEYRLGLSATPIVNYGEDVYNIFDIISPKAFGDKNTFLREWCSGSGLRDAKLFGHYLRKNMLMLRRTREDVALELPAVNRIVYTVDADLRALEAMEKEAKALALKVLSGSFSESGQAARELDWKLRHATGVAKAKAVCEIVKAIVHSGEPVCLVAWHHDVYSIFKQELADLKPVFYTGTESVSEKNKSLEKFRSGESKVFVLSLRSGSGINGLQEVSSHMVFAELDWSPSIFDQACGRLWREGQTKTVNAIFITVNDGSDPVMIETLGLKSSEARAIMDPKAKAFLQTSDGDKIAGLAKKYLMDRGYQESELSELRVKPEDKNEAGSVQNKENLKTTDTSNMAIIADPKENKELMGLINMLRQTLLPTNQETLMQDALEEALKSSKIAYDREFSLSKESRLDFLINKKIIVECKVDGFNKRDLLRQLKRYIVDANGAVEAVIIVTPTVIRNFMLDGVPVYAVNASNAALLVGGLS